MAFILDTSVALAWILPDEGSEATDALADRLVRETAIVPAIWLLEVGNALLVAVRRGRLSENERARLTSGLAALPIEVEPGDSERAFGDVLDLAGKLDLSAYDAAYLELARRRQLPLATLDRRLRDACARLGVAVLPEAQKKS